MNLYAYSNYMMNKCKVRDLPRNFPGFGHFQDFACLKISTLKFQNFPQLSRRQGNLLLKL